MENLEELNVRLKKTEMERDRAYSLLQDVKSVIDATEES